LAAWLCLPPVLAQSALSKTANYLDKNHCFLSQKLKMNYFQFFASNFAKNEKVMAYCEPHSISVK
jgi:hypothetical protein